MSRPGADPTQSGFVQFPDHSARDRFIRSTLDQDQDLKNLAFISENRPSIIFDGLTVDQRDRIRSALEGLGRWFDDVQFHHLS